MAYNLAYNTNSSILDINSLRGCLHMATCEICKKSYKRLGPEKGCSIKCKLLQGIKKNENGCWLFRNSTAGQYSKIRWKKKWYSAHRCSYEVFNGPISKGKWICHTCDTPKCINPEHLFQGSPKDNRRDSVKKKRDLSTRGESNVFAKYTDDQVTEIRQLKKEGFTYERLKRIFNCSMPYLSAIIKNKLRIG